MAFTLNQELADKGIFTGTVTIMGNVDYFSPWDTPHSGDYDLNDLFAWIDSIVK